MAATPATPTPIHIPMVMVTPTPARITTTATPMGDAQAAPSSLEPLAPDHLPEDHLPAEPLSPDVFALLAAWFSPACPVGAFSYSHGLEALFEAGGLNDREAAEAAIATALLDGGGRADLILLAEAHRAATVGDAERLLEVTQLGIALTPSAERQLETLRQGEAFADIVDAVWPMAVRLPRPLPHPVAVGAAGAGHAVPLFALAHAYALGFCANLVSAAVRLVPLGQTDGQRITAALAPRAARLAQRALTANIEDIGSAALGLDLASMAHECQEVRLYRS